MGKHSDSSIIIDVNSPKFSLLNIKMICHAQGQCLWPLHGNATGIGQKILF